MSQKELLESLRLGLIDVEDVIEAVMKVGTSERRIAAAKILGVDPNRIIQEMFMGYKQRKQRKQLYGVDETLVKHVIDTYEKQPIKKNIGVLLNGAKGTGKTVTAKIMANKLGLPVIICDKSYDGLATFLASINHDCIFFFDEFEKNFRLKSS